MENTTSQHTIEQIKEKNLQWQALKAEVKKVIVGQDYIVD